MDNYLIPPPLKNDHLTHVDPKLYNNHPPRVSKTCIQKLIISYGSLFSKATTFEFRGVVHGPLVMEYSQMGVGAPSFNSWLTHSPSDNEIGMLPKS